MYNSKICYIYHHKHLIIPLNSLLPRQNGRLPLDYCPTCSIFGLYLFIFCSNISFSGAFLINSTHFLNINTIPNPFPCPFRKKKTLASNDIYFELLIINENIKKKFDILICNNRTCRIHFYIYEKQKDLGFKV